MSKKFSELKAGDKFYIWLYNSLIEEKVKSIQTKQSARELGKDERVFNVAAEVSVILDNGNSYYFSYGKDETAMIWGSDGWNEYIILGTSKEAVKSLLQMQLIADAKILEDKTEKWLAEFDK